MGYMLNSAGTRIPLNVISGFNANYLTPSGAAGNWQSYATYLSQALPSNFESIRASDAVVIGSFANYSLFSGNRFLPNNWRGIGLWRATSGSSYSFAYGIDATQQSAFFTISSSYYLSFVFDPSAADFKLTVIRSTIDPAGGTGNYNIVGLKDDVLAFVNLYELVENTDPYSNIDGESDISGGGSGPVSVPGYPGLSATSTGIIGLFVPSTSQMQQLSDFMWTDFGGTGTTTEDILAEIVQALKRLISNPLDYVLGLNIIPSQGLSVGSSKVIKFGFVSSGVSMPELSSQYFTVDCGSIAFDAVCGDTFLDYAPYSKFSVYLPYIGVKEVDANDFVGHTIGIVYHGDVVTGGVTAYITKDDSVMYQFSGCCALNIPLSADNWGNTVSSAVNIATALISGGAAGGAAGIAKAAALGASSIAANPSLLSPQVAHSGAISGGAGAMGVQYPFVIREAVRFHTTEYFNSVSGYPAFYYRSLENISGYTKILNINLENIPATQDEIAEITNILKEGAIF